MPISEQPVVFECQGAQLVGVLASPSSGQTRSRVGLIVVVGGPQYRIGSHRHFVLLTRALAARGIASFRFDVRGMGDSDGEERPFTATRDDIAAAIETFSCHAPGVSRFVLWGLCDGASAAALYAPTDSRILGVVMLNPWVRTASSQARVYLKHYYPRRLFEPGFWKKLLRGRIGFVDAARRLISFIRVPQIAHDADEAAVEETLPERILQGMLNSRADSLVLLSERDYVAREFEDAMMGRRAFAEACAGGRIEMVRIGDSDHTLSSQKASDEVSQRTADWVLRLERRQEWD